MSDELEPIAPGEAVEMYLQHREPDLSEKTYYNHKYRLDAFLEFCEERGITNLNNLTGRDLHRFRTWRSQQDISKMTLRTNLATLRVFLEFCHTIDAVDEGLREKVVLPDVDRAEQSENSTSDSETTPSENSDDQVTRRTPDLSGDALREWREFVPICRYCGSPVPEDHLRCPALDDGRCAP